MSNNIKCLDKKTVNMNSPTCELNLDPASMKIMNVFKQDNIQTLRSENQKLRDRLRQFKESDAKKTQDLKVFNAGDQNCLFHFSPKMTIYRPFKKNFQIRVTVTSIIKLRERRRWLI